MVNPYDHSAMYTALSNQWGVHCGEGFDPSFSISPELWEFVTKTISNDTDYSILEYGSGLSTLLIGMLPLEKHTALECSPHWYAKLKTSPFLQETSDLQLRMLHGTPPEFYWDMEGRYDLILVDGPLGTVGREGVWNQLEEVITTDGCTVIIDDTHRKPEMELAAKIARRYATTVKMHSANNRAFSVVKVN